MERRGSFRAQAEKRDAAQLKHLPYLKHGELGFLPVFFEAVPIVVVAVPAEEADIHEACTDGYPRGAEVDQTEFFKHVPPITDRNERSGIGQLK